MAETMRHRFAIDLDEIERQLKRPSEPQGNGHGATPKGDPLSELARIVGQDDPFRAVLAAEPAAPRVAFAAPARVAEPDEHLFAADAAHRDTVVPLRGTMDSGEMAYALRGPVLSREEEELLGRASAEPQDLVYETGSVEPAIEAEPEPRRSRRGVWAVGAALGVAVLGVGGGLAYRMSRSGPVAGGEVPVVRADAGPTKVQPQNPGGAEVPNQDRRIYDRAAPEGQTRVVSREEQPLDVRQAARSAAPEGPAPNATVAALGEPRRVKTVTIRPDAAPTLPPAPVPVAAPTPPPAAIPAPLTTASTPTVRRSEPAAAPVAPSPPTPPRVEAAAPRAPKPPQQRVAAAVPDAPVPVVSGAPTGGFAVQLAVRPSEQEARAAFEQLKGRFGGELSGQTPMIRKAEVKGNTVYRVRVGPLSRDDANALCNRLQASGGQCFIANN